MKHINENNISFIRYDYLCKLNIPLDSKCCLISADHRFDHPPNIRQPHSFRNSSSNSRSQTGSLPNSGPLNYCTIRRPTTGNLNMNQQKRGVQFADQQDSSSNGQEEMVTNLLP